MNLSSLHQLIETKPCRVRWTGGGTKTPNKTYDLLAAQGDS
jgi:hypothetical protein